METNSSLGKIQKINFLKNELIIHLQKLSAEEKGEWGVMNAQQMVEHLSDAFRNYNGFSSKKILTPAEHLPRMKEFIMSEKPFKPNTKNVEMPEIPSPAKNHSMTEALNELKVSINDFFSYFENEENKVITNMFFGELNFEESLQLLHKHTIHHLKQFRLTN